jgi:hypothetical protein
MNSNLCWNLLVVALTSTLPNVNTLGESPTVSAIQSAEFVVNGNRGSHPAETRQLTIRSILDSKPAERHRLVSALAKERPPLKRIAAILDEPAENNRPPTTPGNEHGKRPVVPPGRRNYGTP